MNQPFKSTKDSTMLLARWFRLLAVCLSLFVTAGCGSSANVTVDGDKTVGQELKDLDEAYQKGTINRQEYETVRKRIIDGK